MGRWRETDKQIERESRADIGRGGPIERERERVKMIVLQSPEIQ